MTFSASRRTSLAAAWWLLSAALAVAAGEPSLTAEQIRDFLRTGRVIKSRQTSMGVTNPWRLTLQKGRLVHDAHFQAIDIRKPIERFATGRTEINFVDSFHYNIAAYELARLLGLEHMVPVTVARKWRGQTGAIAWWLPKKWDEGDRIKQKLEAPDPQAWNRQIYRLRIFNQLIYETDANLGNWVITEDWKVYRVDFTRAFRLHHDLENPRDLVQCDRQLLEKLKQLNEADVERVTKPHLTKSEVKAVMARRDVIVAQFQKLITERGKDAILY